MSFRLPIIVAVLAAILGLCVANRNVPTSAETGGGQEATPESGPRPQPGSTGIAAPARLVYPRRLYDAIRKVESGGNDRAVGDGGRSFGPYQISRAYWIDACKEAGIGADWETGRWDRNCSEWVMFWYAHRYERDALRQGDCEILGKLHNGGPRWRAVKNEWYWQRVKAVMR